jgi:ABC-type antimicrobial peptide transport system permease subunit
LNTVPDAEIYWPYAITPAPAITAVIRSDLPAALLSATIRREIRRLDARLPALAISTLDDVVAESIADSRLLVVLLGLFALFGLAVAASGIYGVASYIVAERRQDVAVRLALGASPRRVILNVVAETVAPVLAGIAVGLTVATGSTSLIADRLFAVSPTDPLTLVAGPIILLAAALAACYGPARRAAGIDPAASLRAH